MNLSSFAALAVAIAATGASIAACSTNNTYTNPGGSSALGESCAQAADCKSGLSCIMNVCVEGEGGTVDAASSGGQLGDGSGSSSGGSVPDSGPEAAPPRLGALGDACQATAQCGPGLDCIPLPTGGGICDLSSYGLADAATGMTCTGECKSAMDCCVPPQDLAINGTAYHSCTALQVAIGTTNCSTLSAGDNSMVGQACFYYQAYCSCVGSPWTCANNQCVFSAHCGASNAAIGGCASESRTGRTFPSTCTGGTCGAPLGVQCTSTADCAGQTYTAFSGSQSGVCQAATATSPADCVCQAGTCYLACNADLDCASGYTCDTTTRLCKQVGSCTSDAQCAKLTNNPLAVCINQRCRASCSSDHDCNQASGTTVPGNSYGDFFNLVCVSGYCQPLGCLADSDCNHYTGNPDPQMFCVPQAPPPAPPEVSAVTN